MAIKEYEEQLDKISANIPWMSMVEEGIIINKNGSLQATLRYRGYDLSSATKSELMLMTQRINNALVKTKGGWTLHIEANRFFSEVYEYSDIENIAGKLVEDERFDYFKGDKHLKSDYFLTVVYVPERESSDRMRNLMLDSKDLRNEFTDSLLIFKKGFENIYNNFKECLYEVKKLNEEETLTYLHSTISTKNHKVIPPPIPQFLDSYLSDCYLVGGLKPRLKDQHLRCVSINNFPLISQPALLDRLNRLNIEYRWVTRFMMLDKLEAERLLDTQFKRHFSGRLSLKQIVSEQLTGEKSVRENADAVSKAGEIEQQKFLTQQDTVCQGYYTTTIVVKNKDINAVEKAVLEIEKTINAIGFTTIDETVNCVEAWLGSLPGDLFHNIRKPIINTITLTHLLPLSTVWTGESTIEKVYEGDRIAPALVFTETEGQTPFALNLKVGDVGHTMILGPTGSGKSTLLNTIAIQFTKYENAQVFIFDKGASSRVTTLGVGGKFYDLGAENNNLSFQPLRRIDEAVDLEFTNTWLQEIFEQENVQLTPLQKEKIYSALVNLSKMEDKNLRTLTAFETMIQDRELKEAIRPYTHAGACGKYFDSDNENFKGTKFMAFEMELIMKNKQAVIPLLRYIFHRIETDMLNGDPSIIVLDECWMFFKNEEFSKKIEEWLRVLRKKKCDVIFATQSPKEIKESAIYNVVLDSCPTKIFLPNPSAKEKEYIELYKEFTLNNKEIDIIQKAIPKKYYYYKSPKGSRLFNLVLGKKALAYVASSSPSEQEKAKEIELFGRHLLEEEQILHFNKKWAEYKDFSI